jgi:HSP20 family protein
MEHEAGRLSWCSTKNHPMSEKEAKRMQEQTKLQPIPVKIYRTHDHLTVAAPMPGLEPEDILVEVTENGQLILHGDIRAALKDDKEVLLDEWNVGGYHRELSLPNTVDGEHANVTYGNGVLVVAFLRSQEMHPALITLAKTGIAHGEYRGNIGGHLQD